MASPESAGAKKTPDVRLRSGDAKPIPVIGMGTAEFPFVPENTKNGVLAAVEAGYRHFDTAAMYFSEQVVGEAIAEATRRGLIASRGEVFVTSKLWCTQCHPDLVLPSLRASLQNLQMEYLDLYLIHWPTSVKAGPWPPAFPLKKEDLIPFDFKGVWQAMEECQRLGLAKAIGVSNFTTKHLEQLLAVATIPPAVNQVELNPAWQQKKLREYCAEKGIYVTAYSPLGGQSGMTGKGNPVLESEVLGHIAKARGKSVAQVSLRWIYEQGVGLIVKTFKKERLKENLEIFDWELTDEDRLKISEIPQQKIVTAEMMFSPEGSFESVHLSDIEVVET